jgi:ATP-dependent DNA helicase RecQ
VPLALPQPKIAKEERQRLYAIPEKSKSQLLKEELFERLVALRRSLAQQQGVPPYLIFSDAALDDMAEKRPLADADMLRVSGMGERKLQLYGDAFISEIRRFVLEKTGEGARITGSTQLITWDLYQKSHLVEEIAEIRGMSTLTVVSHLATMYERGETLDISRWVSPEECDVIQGALPLFEEPYQMKAIFEHFSERYNFDKIRFAIADYRRGV